MEKTVWKYPLAGFEANEDYSVDIELPMGSLVRYADFDNKDKRLCVWAEVVKGAITIPWRFWVVGTNYPVPDRADYISSCQNGPYVVHVYCVSHSSYRMRGGEL